MIPSNYFLFVHTTLSQAISVTYSKRHDLRWDWDTPATRLLVRPTLSGEVMALTDIPPPTSGAFLGRAKTG